MRAVFTGAEKSNPGLGAKIKNFDDTQEVSLCQRVH